MKKIVIGLGIVGILLLGGCSSKSDTTTTSSSASSTSSTSTEKTLAFLSDSQKNTLGAFAQSYGSVLKSIAENKAVNVDKLVAAYNENGNPDEGKKDIVSFKDALTTDSNKFSATSLSKEKEKTEANKRAFLDTVESYLEKKIDTFKLSDSDKQKAFYQTVSAVKYPETFEKSYKSLDRLRPEN